MVGYIFFNLGKTGCYVSYSVCIFTHLVSKVLCIGCCSLCIVSILMCLRNCCLYLGFIEFTLFCTFLSCIAGCFGFCACYLSGGHIVCNITRNSFSFLSGKLGSFGSIFCITYVTSNTSCRLCGLLFICGSTIHTVFGICAMLCSLRYFAVHTVSRLFCFFGKLFSFHSPGFS